MSQQQTLRKRTVASTENMNRESEDFIPRSGLTAESLMKASPTQYGDALKLHIPLLYALCPNFLKRILSAIPCFSFLTPKWKERYLILLGSFLYKFKDRNAPTPKGSPFAVEAVDVHIVSQANISQQESLDGMDIEMRDLPPGCEAVFCVSSLRKKHYYAVSSREECLAWVNSLSQARQEAIKRNMGHSSHVPYPKSYEYFDTLGKNLLKSKERIKLKIEESHVREMEMSSIGEGGPLPRGYYG